MRIGFYPKMALSGMKKNGKLYVPYLLTCIAMVTMYFLISFISYCPVLQYTKGGATVSATMGLGKFVIVIFAAIFLAYTNSFLVRRRNKEFGLYNVLGMDKRGIMRIVAWETLMVGIISIFTGLLLGIALSKFTELGLLNLVKAQIDYGFYLPWPAVSNTISFFAFVFVLLFVKSLIQVWRSKPLELMKSEAVGEKAPKANWFLAVIGAIMLAVAYYMAVTIKSPIKALMLFFIAVILVIIATYLLFIAGSVAFCKLLQKNKKYYYHKNHFVSVSSMVYRMKRNGAGLASICVLSTMVLVMFSSSASLYLGQEDLIRNSHPRNLTCSMDIKGLNNMNEDISQEIERIYGQVLAKQQVKPENELSFLFASTVGMLEGDSIDLHAENHFGSLIDYDQVVNVFFMSAADYNHVTGQQISVGTGETMIYTYRFKYTEPQIRIEDVALKVAGQIENMDQVIFSQMSTDIVPSILIVVDDLGEINSLAEMKNYNGEPMVTAYHFYGFDSEISGEDGTQLLRTMCRRLMEEADFMKADGSQHYIASSEKADREDFYSTFGGLFFLGILLSIIFIFATVLIIYYKQVSEGYEDQARFGIMKKVGMTGKEIRKSINSQILTVFYLPLIMAGMHLVFAFPIVWKILQLFEFTNMKLVIAVNAGCFVVFGICYALIYKFTAGAYFSIVSGAKSDK